MKKLFFLIMGLFLSLSEVLSQEFSTKSTSLTVYQNNFGTVQQTIELKLSTSPAKFSFPLPSTNIVPTSIFLTFEGDVLEQSLTENFGLFENWKEKAIGKEITLLTSNGQVYKGQLALFDGDELVLNTNDNNSIYLKDLEGVSIVFNNYQFQQGKKPEVNWLLKPKKTGTQTANLFYHTNGVTWSTRYYAYLDDNKQTLNLFAKAAIQNRTGIDFDNVDLRIVEGELNIQQDYSPRPMKAMGTFDALAVSNASIESFESEKNLFEYYQYTYPQKITLKNNETKLLQMFTAEKVPYKKKYTYTLSNYPQLDRKVKPQIQISFKNSKEDNLGMLIPMGQVDFYMKTNDRIEFLGETRIRTVPIGDETKLNIGSATDLAVEVKNADEITIGKNATERNFKLVCYNFKDKEATIEITYYTQSQSTELIKSNIKPKEQLPSKLVFDVPIKGNSQTELSFTIQSKK